MAADAACCEPKFWVYLMISVGLVTFAGIMSGLTLGLMSLSLVDLEVLIKAGQPKDQLSAAKILPVVKNQHLLLCTLLIGNSLAMEALPIFLDALVPAWGAILISVTLILAFGEIIPQSVCSRYGLSVGARMAGVVRVLLLVFFPIAYPISKLLDWLLGKGHVALMRRAELKTLVDMHGNEAGKGGELTHDETTIIAGALELTQKTAKYSMTTTRQNLFWVTDPQLKIFYKEVKNLLTCRPEDEVPVRNVTIRKIPRVYDDLPLYDILNEFQKGHSHMAAVVKRTKNIDANMEKSKNSIPENGAHQSRRHLLGDGIPAEHLDIIMNASAVSSIVTESQSPVLRSNWEKHGDVRSQMKKSDRGRQNNILDVSESLPSYSLDEEVVGIITMEDVMEELLQEEILDETDEYVDVHNKIKINMLPAKRLSSRSPKASPLSHFQRQTPLASPLSPHNRTSISHSPVSPYAQTFGSIPTISSTPGRSIQSLPGDQTHLDHFSPASPQASL